MAVGDAAVAAGMTLVSGGSLANTLDTEDNRTRDYVANFGIKPGTALAVSRGGTGGTTVASARNGLGLGNTSGPVPVANGGTGATTASAARTKLDAAATSHTHSQYASKNALGQALAVADITTSPTHALGMFYRPDIARPVIRVDASDFPVATWPSVERDDLHTVIQALRDQITALEERLAKLEPHP